MPQRLERLFDQGVLVRPTDSALNLVHVVRAIATVTGARDFRSSGCVREALDLISPAEHLIFVLLDGLGMSIVNSLPPESFIRSHVRRQIIAGCPSTTACALTTVATAEYANCHGITGWFTYLPEFELTATVLPFMERFANLPLKTRGLEVSDVICTPTICRDMKCDVLTIVPAFISETPYNHWARGGTRGVGYFSFHHAFEQAITHVVGATGSTYTHVYLPEIDSQCHKTGACHADIVPLVMQIDHELKRMAGVLEGRARIVFSADHGLIDVPREQQQFLFGGDPMLDLLHVPPSGDARMPVFHVRSDKHTPFVEMFERRFGEQMVLLSMEEAKRMEFFGCGDFSPAARPRFGDFIAIPYRPATLAYHAPDKPLGNVFLAVHGGMSPQEMQIPLCIA
jgi:type I phosphodiesterase/nucleotide pyrophosphatase